MTARYEELSNQIRHEKVAANLTCLKQTIITDHANGRITTAEHFQLLKKADSKINRIHNRMFKRLEAKQ